MFKKNYTGLSLVTATVVVPLVGCTLGQNPRRSSERGGTTNALGSDPNKSADPLPSWYYAATRRKIVAFVNGITDPNSESFVKVEERIATFDNDGTL